MKHINYLLVFTSLITLHSFAMDSNPDTIPALANLDGAPRYYARLVAQVFEQPLFDGHHPFAKDCKECKVLSLESDEDCRIAELLNKNAKKIPGYGSNWSIHTFGMGEYQLYSSSGQRINQGLQLFLYDNSILCAPQDLETMYDHLIETVKNGWSASPLDQHVIKPGTEIHSRINGWFAHHDTELEKKWVLFVKEKPLIEEDILIKFLARKFNVRDTIGCDSKLLKQPNSLERHERLYLVVRKNALDKVKSTLQLNLPS